MKLHLGCGDCHLEGWINVDRRYQPGVDRVDNIGLLTRLGPDSVDAIYCCHALDHFSRHEYPRVLARWFILLKPGGILQLSMPDFRAIAEHYESYGNLEALTGALYAAQDYEDNVRHFIWDRDLATKVLRTVGFEEILEFVPFVNDCSQLRKDGIPMSLNIQGRKPHERLDRVG